MHWLAPLRVKHLPEQRYLIPVNIPSCLGQTFHLLRIATNVCEYFIAFPKPKCLLNCIMVSSFANKFKEELRWQ